MPLCAPHRPHDFVNTDTSFGLASYSVATECTGWSNILNICALFHKNYNAMKYVLIIAIATLFLSSCSDNDGPVPDVFTQVSEITNGKSESKTILYDDYGRVIKFVATFPDATISSTYSYIGEDLIKIHTEHIIPGYLNGDNAITQYDDELHLKNGRAVYCNGIYTTNQFDQGRIFQKKYRHDFTYTTSNHLNVVKHTEWYKNGDDWDYEKPLSWENYYIWVDDNLVTVEDFNGNQTPTYVYKYSYSSVSGVQNVLPMHLERYQYFPLQLKGCFGAGPVNLIKSIEQNRQNASNSEITYQYNIIDNKITDYTETKDGVSDKYYVTWIE